MESDGGRDVRNGSGGTERGPNNVIERVTRRTKMGTRRN